MSLQHKIKLDPGLVFTLSKFRFWSLIPCSDYFHDFQHQLNQFESNRHFLLSAPSSKDNDSLISFRNQIDFLSNVADCYPKDIQEFPDQLIELLEKHHDTLEAETREKIVGNLVLLRRKKIIDSDKCVIPLHLQDKSRSRTDVRV